MKMKLYIKKIFYKIVQIARYPKVIYFKIRFSKFGKGSYILKPIIISNPNNIEVGDRVFIWPNARLEAVTEYVGEQYKPKIIICDDVGIQQNFHCTCSEEIYIGKGTSITQNVGIFDIIHPYEDINVNPRFQNIQTKKIFIGENCLIGMNSVILPGTKLGKHNIVGACSVVHGEFPDYCVIAGSPARIIKKYNFSDGKWEKVSN